MAVRSLRALRPGPKLVGRTVARPLVMPTADRRKNLILRGLKTLSVRV